MDLRSVVEATGTLGVLESADREVPMPIPGGLASAGEDYQFDRDRPLVRFAGHSTVASIDVGSRLAADVLRAWEQSLAAGDIASVSRLIVLARTIRVADTRHNIGMIG